MTTPAQVLIVDDDAAFVRIYREIFEPEGLVVIAASSTVEAVETLARVGPELSVVLLDQKLQGPGGPRR